MDKEKIINYADKGIEYLLYLMILFIPISKAAIEITFGIAFTLFLVKKSLRPDFKFLRNPAHFFLLLFFIFCALSLFNSGPLLFKSFRALFGKWLKYILIFLLAEDTLNTNYRLRNAVAVFFTVTSIIVVDAFFQYFFGVDFIHGYPPIAYYPTASFENQNSLVAYLVPFSIMGTIFFFSRSVNKSIRFSLLCFVIAAYTILALCASRGGWVGLLFGLLLWGILSRKFIHLFIAIGIFSVILLAVGPSRQRAINSFLPGHSGERLEFMATSLKMVKDSPILGRGLGTYMDRFSHYSSVPGASYAHNSYLQMAAETGVFTLFFFLLFIGSILYKAGCFFKESHNYILLGLIFAVFGFSAHAFFDNHFYSLRLVVLFWFLLGLTHAAANLKET